MSWLCRSVACSNNAVTGLLDKGTAKLAGTLAVAAFHVAVMPSFARAADWSAILTASEKATYNDNPGLASDPNRQLLGALSTLSLDITGKTRTAKVDFQGDFTYQKYWGLNGYKARDASLPRLSAALEKYWKTTSFKADASYSVSPASKTDLAETDITSSKTNRETFKANAAINKKLDQRNELNFIARNTTISYSDGGPTVTPSTSTGGTVSWLHRATRRIDFTTSAGVDWTLYDNAANSENLLYFTRAEVVSRPIRRLKLTAGAGVQYLDAYQDNLLLPGFPRDHTGTLGWTGNAGFDYALKTGSISGSTRYGYSPTVDGVLQQSLLTTLSADHKINDVSNIGLTARLYMADTNGSGSFDETSLTLTPTYSRTLTRLWRMQASYSFVIADTGTGTAIQNAAFLSFSRKFEIVP